MKKSGIFCLLLAAGMTLCACSKEPTSSELVEEWMADATETEPVTVAQQEADEIDAGATPLSSFEYTIREDGTAEILRFTGKDTNVVITSRIGDAPVTEIAQYAFEAAWDVETVTLPESVTAIGEFAFMDCGSLTGINIPEGVTALYRGTFAGCGALTELTIPAAVAQTNEELLTGCPLTDLYVKNPQLSYSSWGLEELDPKCTIHAPAGAVILTWAQENGFPTAEE